MFHNRLLSSALFLLLTGMVSQHAKAGFLVFEGTGADPASIQATVDSYRAALGTLNPNTPVSFPNGRREINWDGVPDAFSDNNAFPGNFFNGIVAGRARGIEFSTPGTGLLVSADSSNPSSTPISFGFPLDFIPFSAQRMFSPTGSNILDINFFVPGTTDPASVTGFGAVFNDVELAGITTMEVFGIDGSSLFIRSVLVVPASGGLSFLGVQADAGERIGRIRLSLGDASLQSNGNFSGGSDGVVLDDFIYAEPQAIVPEPASVTLVALGIVGLFGYSVRRRKGSV